MFTSLVPFAAIIALSAFIFLLLNPTDCQAQQRQGNGNGGSSNQGQGNAYGRDKDNGNNGNNGNSGNNGNNGNSGNNGNNGNSGNTGNNGNNGNSGNTGNNGNNGNSGNTPAVTTPNTRDRDRDRDRENGNGGRGTPQCPNGCGQNGVCSAPGQCACKNGWTGSQCQVPPRNDGDRGDRDKTRCQGGCGNGRCVGNNVCECSPGYGGPNCNVAVCTSGCGGSNGYCSAPNVCTCLGGWSGSDCSRPPNRRPSGGSSGNVNIVFTSFTKAVCTPNCVNGACFNGQCQCQIGYSGQACDIATPVPQQQQPQQQQSTGPRALGDSCYSNDDCSSGTRNSYCEQFSLTCKTGGICMCKRGYVISNNQCLLPIRLGDDCATRPEAVCVENTHCSLRGTCECDLSFKPGPLNQCASSSATRQLGDECQSSEECYYDLVCNRGTCACAPGRVSDSGYTCRALTYGDSCSGDRDCAHLDRTKCIGGTCQCQTGYNQTSYTTERGDKKTTCADATIIKAGASCPATFESVCQDKYACISCVDAIYPVCMWPSAKGPDPMAAATNITIQAAAPPASYHYSGSATFLVFVNTILLFVVIN